MKVFDQSGSSRNWSQKARQRDSDKKRQKGKKELNS